MTDDNVRFHAQRALMALEWLDRHIQARRPAEVSAVVKAVEEMRKHLHKLVGTSDVAIAD